MPGLRAPLTLWQQDFAYQPTAPELLSLLARARRTDVSVRGLERTLLHQLGFAVHEQLPWAGLRYAAEGGNADKTVLMCADPVSLSSGSDSVVLSAKRPQLSMSAVNALQATLNQHLAEDGLMLHCHHPQQWYLCALDAPFARDLPQTTPPSELPLGQVFSGLPRSPDNYWLRLFNEIQMLLHTHPVNAERERQGLLPVNALWFWGEGCPTDVANPEVSRIQGGGQLGQVLAASLECVWQSQPAIAAEQGVHWVILDALLPGVQQDQPALWQTGLEQLAPHCVNLLQRLMLGDEVLLYDTAGQQWGCRPTPFWAWRRGTATWSQLLPQDLV